MKLNLCCGANIFPGWVNVDKVDMEPAYLRHLRDAPDGFVWPEPQRALAAHVKAGLPLEFMQYDVRRGLLPWETGSVDAIYIGQAIEHFNRRTEAPALLRECLRVLKPGSFIKLTTPDLEKIILALVTNGLGKFAVEQPAFYAPALPMDQFSYLLFGSAGEGCTAENFEGHFHAYTEETLRALLEECGFACDVFATHGIFPLDGDRGMTHSFQIQARRP